jgi:molecular chaperone GrpE
MTKKAHQEAHEPENSTEKQTVDQPVDEQCEPAQPSEELPLTEASLTTEYEEAIGSLNLKLADMTDKYLRLSAEFDNYRKRTLKEKMELTKTAGEGILKSVLPLIDDFDRALSHLDSAQDLNAMRDGIMLIYGKFIDFVNQQGVKEIPAKDQVFDTDLHEAITNIPAPTPEMKGKVIDCVEKGYMLNDKVIRFSKVVVGE